MIPDKGATIDKQKVADSYEEQLYGYFGLSMDPGEGSKYDFYSTSLNTALASQVNSGSSK